MDKSVNNIDDVEDDTMSSVYVAWHEMLESENSSMAERVYDLERQVLEQQEEILSLKSTLSEVLRRLNILDCNSSRISSSTTSSSSSYETTIKNNRIRSTQISTTLDDWRLKRNNSNNNSSTNSPSRLVANSKSNLNRRSLHHQSNGSLHSADSQSSTSPAPSPLPRPATVHSTSSPLTPNNLQQQSSASNLSTQSGNGSPTGLGKRWNSTGDFVTSPVSNGSSALQSNRYATKSLLNLQSKNSSNNLLKHGSSSAQRDEDNNSVRMYLRGRPINVYVPESKADSYEITKVQPAPSKKLKLDWVYGYRGKDCRSNLFQLPTGEIIYFVAATVVLYNIEEQSQRHYIGHTDDVKSLTIHPNKLLIATGQCAGHDRKMAAPHIRVWNSVSLATMAVIGINDFQTSVNCVSFSQADNGSLLLAIDDSTDKIISVWEWQKGETGKKITETKCSVDTVVAAEFHPLDRNQIITIGKGHVAFWTLDQNGALYKKMGVFDNREKPKYVTCLTFTPFGDVVTGDSNGNIILWGRGTNAIGKFVKKVHEGSVFSLCSLRNGKMVSGGGKDGRLVLLGEDLMPVGLENFIEPHFGAVRVVTQGKGMQLLIGTTKNCILAGDLDMGFTPVVMGHTDELWGLAIHPNMPQFITGGRDRLLQLWDSLSHSVVWSKDIGEQVQSCEFTPDGELVLVGALSGKWLVFDTMSRELLQTYTDGQEALQTIKCSPNGQYVAIGSRDNTIYIYQRTNTPYKFTRIGKCTGHSSFILHVDWSVDSEVLRSNSGDYEILFWNPNLCRQITNSSSLRDVDWATQSCTLSYETIGIWPDNADGTDINVANRSHDKHLMATGDDFGKVKLFTYPACQPKSLSYSYNGHSSHVTSVGFLHDDTRLISTGGADTSVLQWAII